MMPTTGTPTSVTSDDQFFSLRIVMFQFYAPPVLHAITHKFRCIFTRTNGQIGLVPFLIINPVRNCNPCGKTEEIMIIDHLILFHIYSSFSVQLPDMLFFLVSILRIGLGLPISASPTVAICSNWVLRSGTFLNTFVFTALRRR